MSDEFETLEASLIEGGTNFADAYRAGLTSKIITHEIKGEHDRVALVPDGFEVQDIAAPISPKRHSGKHRFADPDSFVEFVTHHEKATCPARVECGRAEFLAVLNPASSEDPAFEDWQAFYCPQHSPEWCAWKLKDGTAMKQTEFAEFIEEWGDVIVDPDSASMLEIATTFQAKTTADFRRSVRLDNGQIQLGYDETIESKAGAKGTLEVPSKLHLRLPIYEGAESSVFDVVAHFRPRCRDGSLTLSYKLHRPDRAEDSAREEIAKEMGEKLERKIYLTA